VYIRIQTLGMISPPVYEIETPSCIYQTQSHGFNNLITLLAPNGSALATVQRKFSIWSSHYEFDLQDGHKWEFQSDRSRKNAYACDIGGDSYVWFVHKGLRYSLFLNGAQIASMTKQPWEMGMRIQCEVLMNDDANLSAVMCFVLASCDMDRGEPGTASYDFGNIGPEDIPFDERWQPS
jgi:hypothetical protein